jgi:hypothetical protein
VQVVCGVKVLTLKLKTIVEKCVAQTRFVIQNYAFVEFDCTDLCHLSCMASVAIIAVELADERTLDYGLYKKLVSEIMVKVWLY